MLSDITLVTQVAVFGNKKAFDQLVRKYQSPVRRFLLNLTLGDSQLSDDLAQDTFIKVYSNIAQFRGLSCFQTWLFRIAYNVFYDYTRKHRMTEDIDMAMTKSLMTSKDRTGMKVDVYEALSILKEEERTCITLQLIDGYPIEDISKITGMPAGTIKSHLHRGKEKMANYLKQNGYGR